MRAGSGQEDRRDSHGRRINKPHGTEAVELEPRRDAISGRRRRDTRGCVIDKPNDPRKHGR